AETMVSRTSLTVGVPGNDNCVILASEGRDAVSIRGITVQVGRFPSRFSAEAGPKQLTLASDDLDDLQQVLGFAPLSGVVTLIPLRAAGLPMGVLMVESPARLPAEHTSAMASVAASAALALTDIRLTEDLRRDIAERRVLEGLQ